MRFRLKTLLLILLLFGGVSVLFLASNRGSDAYQGYFAKRFSIHRLVGQSDSSVRIEGTGGGGGGGSSGPFITKYTHTLKGERAFTEDLVNALQRQVLSELATEGIRVVDMKDVNGGDSNYPTAGVRLTTWGFQVLFDDHGYKGVLTIRLMSKVIRDVETSLGPQAELFENIVVFPRD